MAGKQKKDSLGPVISLTAKQAEFVRLVSMGWLRKDAYRQAYDTNGDDKTIRVAASQLAANKNIALALNEALKHKRLADLVQPGKLVAQTLEDQQAARDDKAHAAVVGYARMLGNWSGIEKTQVTFSAEQLMTDEELIHRLAGDDPRRLQAARELLGAPESFPEEIEGDYQTIEEVESGSGAVRAGTVGPVTVDRAGET